MVDKLAQGLPDFALMGKMGSGKSTLAQYLADHHGYVRLPIAGQHVGGIRDIVTRIWGPEAVNDREKLVAVGDMASAVDDPGVWLRNLLKAVDRLTCHEAHTHIRYQPVVVDDVRRPLEYKGLVKAGFVTVRVWSQEFRRVDRLKASGKWQHEGQLTGSYEIMLDGYHADHAIMNNHTPSSFEYAIESLLYKERRKRA